jgi:hypothetical protein
MNTKTMSRETWLTKMTDLLRPDFIEAGVTLPEKIRSSCGFPSKSALADKTRRIGEAWSCENSEDQSFETFITPLIGDAVEASAVLVHELIHCAVGLECGHKGLFKTVAKRIGLEGKMTATVAGAELKVRLEALVAKIGSYPHAKLVASNRPKKQGTRMLLVRCPKCGCICRMTRKWVDGAGCPICACGTPMATAATEEDGDD